ncbi:MAG: ABC transporter substrate-binding protein [Xanthomonadales bacterium]|nr:ABC transporter substrate-binding protein [Xanthomonadales bacterium]
MNPLYLARVPAGIPALLLAVTLSGCTEPSGTAETFEPPAYRHSLPSAAGDLDPARSGDRYTGFLVQNLFQTLYVYKYLARPYQLKPGLADGFPQVSDDGLRYRIRIRPGQRFSDDPSFPSGTGREVTAADVVYSLKRHFDPEVRSQGTWLWRDQIVGMQQWAEAGVDYDQPVEGLRVISASEIEIFLLEPYPTLIHTLANPLSAVVPREVVEDRGPEFGRRPVGSGPYRLEHLDATHARLTRNQNFPETRIDIFREGYQADIHHSLGLEALHQKGMPILSPVHVEFVMEESSRWLSYNKGDEIEFIRLPASQIPSVLDREGPLRLKQEFESEHHMLTAPELGFVRIDFNMAHPAIGLHPDPEESERRRQLRCAMAATIDWDDRNRVFYERMGRTFGGLAPPGTRDEVPAFHVSSRSSADWGQAESLPVIPYGAVGSLRSTQEFEYFRASMTAAGYPRDRITYQAYPSFGDFARGIANNEVAVFAIGWSMDFPDPINNYQLFYGPNRLPGANYSQFQDDAYDQAYERASRLRPGKERRALLDTMEDVLRSECVSVPGLARQAVFMFHRDIIAFPDSGPINGRMLGMVDRRASD